MNIIEAIHDENLIRPFLEDDEGSLESWSPWLTALECVYGLRPKDSKLVRQCTGREAKKLPADGFDVFLALCGRRSGKSRITAVIGAFEAVLAGHETKLRRGEQGIVACCAPSKRQAENVFKYLHALFEVPLLREQVIRETATSFELRNNVAVEVFSGSFKTIRGFTLVAACVEEACFFGIEDQYKINDGELITALEPGLATTGGKLIVISTPYAQRGWCYKQYQNHFGKDSSSSILVWNAASRVMNKTLSQAVIDRALVTDFAKAQAEYLGRWRTDVCLFIPREVVESLVVEDRTELLPRDDRQYVAFADLSGGRGDPAAISVAHREGRKVVMDLVRQVKPPFNPQMVIQAEFVPVLRRFGIKRITGDNYAAEYTARAFESGGIRYARSELSSSELLAELLPRLCSQEIELLDDEATVSQFASLERRTRIGGRDLITHPVGGHDDLAVVIAGASHHATQKRTHVGPLPRSSTDTLDGLERLERNFLARRLTP